MLTAMNRGRSVNEADIPPPVSTGAPQSQGTTTLPAGPPDQQGEPEAAEPIKEEECSSSTLSSLSSSVAEAKTPMGKYNTIDPMTIDDVDRFHC